MKLLQIDSSARSSSVTRQLTAKFVEEWKRNHPDGEVIQRDLATTMLPHITDDWGATRLEPSQLTPAQRNYLSMSDHLIEELEAADIIVIGAPMHNFAIPSPLKAWIDQVVRLGKTFGYGPRGVRGQWHTQGCERSVENRRGVEQNLRFYPLTDQLRCWLTVWSPIHFLVPSGFHRRTGA